MSGRFDLGERAARLALGGVFAVASLVRGALLARPLPALDGRALPDDAYIAFELAKRIGTGDGPRFVDYLTNGFQPLFVWLTAIPFAVVDPSAWSTVAGLDAMAKWGLAIGCAFDLGSVLLIASIVRQGVGSRAAGVLAAWVWATHPTILRLALNGLETSTAVFFLLLIWRLSLRWPMARATPRQLFALGVVVGVGMMARIDLAGVGLYFAIESARLWRQAPTDWLRSNAALLAGTLAGYAPWMIYSFAYTGTIVPVSGRAVRFISVTHANGRLDVDHYLRILTDAVLAVNGNIPYFDAITVAVGVGWMAAAWRRRLAGESRGGTSLAWLTLPTCFAIALVVAYTGFVFGHWFFTRYLAPINALAVAVSIAGVAELARRDGRFGPWVYVAAGVLAAVPAVTQPRFHELALEPPDPLSGYRSLGVWAREKMPPGTVLGATQTGALAYYADDVRVVNLDGVVNRRAFERAVAGEALDYMREEGIDYVVAWRRNYDYLRKNTRDFQETDLPLAGYLPGFRSWGIQWQIYRVTYPDGRQPPPLKPTSDPLTRDRLRPSGREERSPPPARSRP